MSAGEVVTLVLCGLAMAWFLISTGSDRYR